MVVKLSHSQVNTLTNFCGFSWKLERRDGLRGQPHGSTIAGSAFHNLVEATLLTEHGIPTPIPTPAEAFEQAMAAELERCEGVWTEADIRWSGTNKSKQWPGGQDKTWLLHHLPIWVNQWESWRRAVPWDLWIMPDGKPAVELEFAMELPGGVIDRGFIDAVMVHRHTGEFIVVDWKAGAMEPKSADQLGGYKVGLEDQYGITPTWGTYYMARKGATTSLYDLSAYSMERLAWTFNHAADRIEAEDFLPNMSSCNMCGLKRFCIFWGGEDADMASVPWKTKEEAA